MTGSALAVEGLSERIEIEFSYEEGFDAIGTPAYESASLAHNIQLSTLSDCYFMYVPYSPDGRITIDYPEANFAFCAPSDQDVVGRIDFPLHLQSLDIEIPYFAGGIVTLEAFSSDGTSLFEMQHQDNVGFTPADTNGQSVAWVILSGNQNNAAINIDNLVLKTEGVSNAVIQQGSDPMFIEAVDFESIENPFNPLADYWLTTIDHHAHGGALFSISPSADLDNPTNQDSIIAYPLVMTTPGEYYLYVRARTRAETSSVADSRLWVSTALNESIPAGPLEITPNNTYRWHQFGPIVVDGSDLNKVSNLHLGVRTNGISVDELVLAKSAAFSGSWLTNSLEQSGKPAWVDNYDALEFDWTQIRGNRRRTGHSRIVGEMDSAPVIESSLSYEHNRALLGLDLDSTSPSTITPFDTEFEDISDFEFNKNWAFDSPVFDVNSAGDEQVLRPSRVEKFGHFLPGEPNLQRISTGRTNARVDFEIWNGGGWDLLWFLQDGALKDVGQPMVGDFDNDGRQEAIILPWTNLWLVDLETGVVEQTAQFIPDESDNGRPYGWAGAIDMFEDIRTEVLIIGDFHNHMEVLGWNGSNELEKRWDWMIENGISAKETLVHSGVNPIGDVIDGNGMLEIVVSVFNATGDSKWHTLILNSKTGEALQDLPDVYISRLHDVNDDGFQELMLTPTTGRLIRENAGGSVVSFAGGSESVLFSFSEGRFAEYEIQAFPDHINSFTGKERETVFVAEFDSGKPVFSTWGNSRGELNFHRFMDSENVEDIGGVDSGVYINLLEPVGFDRSNSNASEILLQARAFDDVNELNVDFPVTKFSNRNSGTYRSEMPVIGRMKTGEAPAIVVYAGLDLVRKATMQAGVLHEDWSMQGRSTSIQMLETAQNTLLADVTGDEHYELLVGGQDVSGAASLTASNDGSPIWTTVFEGFQGWLPNWNENGMTGWHAGRFNGGEKDDVAVSLRKSSMHSDQTHVLNGSDGSELWQRRALWQGSVESNGRGRGAGGSLDLAMDVDMNNSDELIISSPDGIAIVKGQDGEIYREKWSHELYGRQVFMRQTIPLNDSSGLFRIAAFDSEHSVSLIDSNLDLVWTAGSGEAAQSTAVLADVDGDGVNEMVVLGDDNRNSIVAYDNSGNRKWTFSTSFSIRMGVAADIDNDGRDEVLFVDGSQLKALEQSGSSPDIKWTWSSPTGRWFAAPAVGDVDDDGDLEIVIFDGHDLYVLGNNASTPAPAEPVILLQADQFEAGDLRISWGHAAFATGYQVLISSDAGMSNIIHDLELPRTQTRVAQSFEPGEYWVRVVASNPQGSSDSALHHVIISEAQNVLPGIFASGFE